MRILLQPQQSASSILTAFLESKDDKVDLVFPSSTTFFEDPANLELLMAQSKLIGKAFCIVTENGELAKRLSSMGIEVKHARAIKKKKEETFPPPINMKKSQSFEEIRRELKENNADEFTKRYFDLEAPRTERITPLGLEKEKDSEQIVVAKDTPIEVRQAVVQEPGLFGKDTKSIFTNEEIASLVKKPLEDSNHPASAMKSDLSEELALSKHHSRRFLWFSIGILLVALAGVLWAFIALPKADISIFAQREKVAFSVDVLATDNISEIDLENRSIPLQRIQSEKNLSSSFDAKTQGNIEKKAQGTITVMNELSHPQVMIPSRFQALTGQIYWSQRNIKIPAARRVEGKVEPGALLIEIEADKPGSEFNLECSQANPCKFSIPAWKGTENFDKLYAVTSSPIKGGAIGQGFIVDQEEYKKAELELKENLLREAQKELSAQVPVGFTLLENTISSEVGRMSASHKAGELTADGKITLQGGITIRAFLFKTNDIKALVDKITKTQLSQEKVTRPESASFEYSVQQFSFEKNQALLKIQAQEELQFNIDPQTIEKQLLGRSETEVQKILTDMPHVQSAEVVLWPFWVRKIPANPKRVSIEIK